jgi:hypothetical protein
MTAAEIVEGIKKASDDIKTTSNDTRQKKKRKHVGEERNNSSVANNAPASEPSKGDTLKNDTKRKDKPNSSHNERNQHDDTTNDAVGEALDTPKGGNMSNLGAARSTTTLEPDSNYEAHNGVKALTEQQKQKLEPPRIKGVDENNSDDSSMGDFPEIVDEGPDEEDIV